MILITGGAGYIGSHSAIDFIKSGYDVVILDNLSTGHLEIIERLKKFSEEGKEGHGKLVDFINADIRDSYALNVLFNTYKIDCVVHFAAASLVNESVNDPKKYYNNNVFGSINLLNSMVENNVKKIVFSSTCATYGEPKKVPIDESHPQKPVNPYGNTKLSIEFLIKDYAKAYDLNYTIFRYFNVIGADSDSISGEWHDVETHLVPNILKADNQKVFNLFGDDYKTPDGTCIRDYIDVCDLARAHTMAYEYLENPERKEENIIVNLGTGTGQSVKEIFSAVEKTLDIKVPIKIEKRREGDPEKLVANTKYAFKTLGWENKTSLSDSIKNAGKWETTLKEIKGIKEPENKKRGLKEVKL